MWIHPIPENSLIVEPNPSRSWKNPEKSRNGPEKSIEKILIRSTGSTVATCCVSKRLRVADTRLWIDCWQDRSLWTAPMDRESSSRCCVSGCAWAALNRTCNTKHISSGSFRIDGIFQDFWVYPGLFSSHLAEGGLRRIDYFRIGSWRSWD